jgi:hypothetical protein
MQVLRILDFGQAFGTLEVGFVDTGVRNGPAAQHQPHNINPQYGYLLWSVVPLHAAICGCVGVKGQCAHQRQALVFTRHSRYVVMSRWGHTHVKDRLWIVAACCGRW